MFFRSSGLMTLQNFLFFVAYINFTFTFISIFPFILYSSSYRFVVVEDLILSFDISNRFERASRAPYFFDKVLSSRLCFRSGNIIHSHVHIVKQAIYVVEVSFFFSFACLSYHSRFGWSWLFTFSYNLL